MDKIVIIKVIMPKESLPHRIKGEVKSVERITKDKKRIFLILDINPIFYERGKYEKEKGRESKKV